MQDSKKNHVEKLLDQEEARLYLEKALKKYKRDSDPFDFFLALKDVVEAQGGMSKLAKKAGLNRQNLYKVMSGDQSPRLETITQILHALGFRFSLEAMNDC